MTATGVLPPIPRVPADGPSDRPQCQAAGPIRWWEVEQTVLGRLAELGELTGQHRVNSWDAARALFEEGDR